MVENDYPALTRMSGIELEFFLLDEEGNIANKADLLIENLKSKLQETEIKQECGESMLEITSFPHISTREVFGKFFSDFETLLFEVETNGLGLFCYGTYPGENSTKMRKDLRYNAKAKILGDREFLNAGRCIGFHYHYTLPRNTFNQNIKFFYPDINEKNKDRVVNLFNLYIALDPAINTLMQSSPYLEGKLIGKDARVIAYRGDPVFDFPDSLYSKYPEFGTLNEYSEDFKTIVERTMDRTRKWKELLAAEGFTFSDFKKEELSVLDSSWKPVKISPHGTIEARGADMNSLSKVVAISSLLKNISQFVQNNSIKVLPSETGNKEPFKLEDNTLYVPESKYLLNELQKKAALSGMEDSAVLSYTKALLELVAKVIPPTDKVFLNCFKEMTEEKKNVSDSIIEYVKKKQGNSFGKIEKETSQMLAVESSEKLFKELLMTKRITSRTSLNSEM